MLKRIISLEKDKKTKKKVIAKISSPIEEENITKAQLQQYKDYIIVDNNKFEEKKQKAPKEFGKQYEQVWDEETQSIKVEEVNLPFEQMNLEQKVDFLYNTLIKPTLPPDEEEEILDETDE